MVQNCIRLQLIKNKKVKLKIVSSIIFQTLVQIDSTLSTIQYFSSWRISIAKTKRTVKKKLLLNKT